jgi:hypothetical protein
MGPLLCYIHILNMVLLDQSQSRTLREFKRKVKVLLWKIARHIRRRRSQTSGNVATFGGGSAEYRPAPVMIPQ